MFIGSGIIELLIADSRSLKEKRAVLKSILKRTQNEFNVSIAEVGDNELWGRAKIGFSVVGNDHRFVDGKINHMLRFIEDLHLAEVVNMKVEIMGLSDEMPPVSYEEKKYDIV
jgi:uncharacterized protein YlxP (DUF503 family)